MVVGDGFEPSKAELTDLQETSRRIINNKLYTESSRLWQHFPAT